MCEREKYKYAPNKTFTIARDDQLIEDNRLELFTFVWIKNLHHSKSLKPQECLAIISHISPSHDYTLYTLVDAEPRIITEEVWNKGQMAIHPCIDRHAKKEILVQSNNDMGIPHYSREDIEFSYKDDAEAIKLIKEYNLACMHYHDNESFWWDVFVATRNQKIRWGVGCYYTYWRYNSFEFCDVGTPAYEDNKNNQEWRWK